ncbi:MAG: glycosyltransferase [Euryhalocaulis sp.]|uniref:glycosyltransferase n=1 Tax=Euryhalocaulis sp. TaxID=2744307 RepID=UPI001831F616|nr:glycosyltransferase [Euryhalocaulis sp.]MBA4802004.1 glycosyltransferase [Euryhalocaulis sp.]
MRLMHVMAGAKEGGAENIMLESVLALAEMDGVEQRVVTRPDNRHRIEEFEKAGITVDTASFDNLWRLPTDQVLKRAIKDFQPDLIEYWMGRAGTYAPRAYKRRQIGWYGGYYKLQRFTNCDWHVGLTKDLCRHICEQGVPQDRIGLIHTTADFENTAPVDRASLQTPEDAPVMLALARLHWKKGLDVLLEALADLPGHYAWIAGEGPLEMDLKEQAEKLGVADRAKFLGWRNDRGALLAACDVVAFPSRYEPFGTVTVDAWAAKRPLVAADAVGPAAYVKHGENGLLVPKDDVDAFREAIRRVAEEDGLAEKLVAGGTETYQATFTKAAFQRDSMAFYEKILAAVKA